MRDEEEYKGRKEDIEWGRNDIIVGDIITWE